MHRSDIAESWSRGALGPVQTSVEVPSIIRRVRYFDKLHSQNCDDQVVLYAFDLIEIDGDDWRSRPLEERKARLVKLLNRARDGIYFNVHLDGDGRDPVRARLPHEPRRHRLKAPRSARLGPIEVLQAEVGRTGKPRDAARLEAS